MMIREWIIFALCLGVGGHIALGVILHAPGYWPWSTAGFYGLLSGLVLYGVVQVCRALWKALKHHSSNTSNDEPGPSW
jgi:hypothetical protein